MIIATLLTASAAIAYALANWTRAGHWSNFVTRVGLAILSVWCAALALALSGWLPA